jgi:hypothetical protein
VKDVFISVKYEKKFRCYRSLIFSHLNDPWTILPAITSRDFTWRPRQSRVVMYKESSYYQSHHELITPHSLTGPDINSYSAPTTTTSLPEFVRLPKPGSRCHWTGLSRSALCELILPSRAPVRSVVLKRRGAKRGIRLIHLPSLIAYLHTLTPLDVTSVTHP